MNKRVTCHPGYSTKYSCSPDHGIQSGCYALFSSSCAFSMKYPAARIVTVRNQKRIINPSFFFFAVIARNYTEITSGFDCYYQFLLLLFWNCYDWITSTLFQCQGFSENLINKPSELRYWSTTQDSKRSWRILSEIIGARTLDNSFELLHWSTARDSLHNL